MQRQTSSWQEFLKSCGERNVAQGDVLRSVKHRCEAAGILCVKRGIFLLKNERTWVRLLGRVPVRLHIPPGLLWTSGRAEFAERRVEPHRQCLLFLSTNRRPETKMKICVAMQIVCVFSFMKTSSSSTLPTRCGPLDSCLPM